MLPLFGLMLRLFLLAPLVFVIVLLRLPHVYLFPPQPPSFHVYVPSLSLVRCGGDLVEHRRQSASIVAVSVAGAVVVVDCPSASFSLSSSFSSIVVKPPRPY
jgi:hypothetical protein